MNLRDTFDSLDAIAVDDYIAGQQEENLHLDFKLINKAEMTKDDRRNLAKALSGFANSDGGLIVWGVDARKNAEGVDCASGRTEIPSLIKFLSRLNQLTSEAVNPAVDGVIHKKIVVADDTGFAVTLVPASDSGPHMAKAGEDRYFKRSGDSFIRLEHFDLEDMFGRRRRPLLELCYRLISGTDPGSSGKLWPYSLVLRLKNSGRASATAPMLKIWPTDPWRRREFGIDGNRTEGLKRQPLATGDDWFWYQGGTDFVLHPRTALDVCALTCSGPPPGGFPAELTLPYEIAAENCLLTEGVLELSRRELRALRIEAKL